MAKAVADVDSGSNQGGFTTEGGNVTGFSTMHDSGTGTSFIVESAVVRDQANMQQVAVLPSATSHSFLTHRA